MLKTSNDQRKLLPNFEQLFATTAQAPGGVARLRELILTLAVQGKLVPQDPGDEPASELLKKIRAEKERLIAEGKIKKDKPLPAITDEEKPFELPVGWEWVRCADYFIELCTGPFGSVIHQEDYVENGIPLINPSHMVNGWIVHDPQISLSHSDAERLSAYRLSAGDIVLARRGEVGRYAIVTDREDGWLCGTGSFFLRLISDCDRSYLALIFRDSRFRRHLQGESVGTTMTNLNQRILLEALIAIPPLAEQSRIVTRVEELMRLCDALEEKGRLEQTQHQQLLQAMLESLTQTTDAHDLARHWQRLAQHFDLLIDRPEAVDALEQTILQLAVRGLLVPQDPSDEPASDVLLGDIAELINGDRGSNYPNKEEYVEEGIPFINTGHIDPDGKLSDARMNKITRVKFDSLRSGKVRKNDLVYCLRGATLGKTAIVEYEEGAIASSLVIIRPSDKVNKDFLYLFLVSPEGRKNIYLYDNGSAQPNLAANSVRKYKIKLPSLLEQSRIVARVTELRAQCQQLREKLTQARTTQTQLAQAWVEQVA